MLKGDTRMTSLLILHQMANEKGVTQEKIWAVILGYNTIRVERRIISAWDVFITLQTHGLRTNSQTKFFRQWRYKLWCRRFNLLLYAVLAQSVGAMTTVITTSMGYPETIEQELQHAVCEQRQTDVRHSILISKDTYWQRRWHQPTKRHHWCLSVGLRHKMK